MAISRYAVPPLPYTPNATDLTVAILIALDPYDRAEILPTNWLIWRVGCNYSWGQEKLRTLVAAGLIERVFFGYNNNSEMPKYIRTPVGERYLIDRGYAVCPFDRAKAKNRHQLFGSMIDTSIFMGAEEHGFSIDTPKDILNNKKCPQATRDSKTPFSFYVNGERLTPDGNGPRVLRSPVGSKLLLREDDRHTEQLSASDYATTIHNKLEKWNIVFKRKLFRDKYGIESAALLLNTVNDRHKDNIKALTLQTLGPTAWLLLKSSPTFKNPSARIEPATHFLSEPYERAGFPDYSLVTQSEV
jgi:hypothetical protein